MLGLDVGERRIGIAISDSLRLTAQRLMVLERTKLPQDLEALAQLVQAHDARVIVVGLPLTMRGARGPQAQRVQTFAKALGARVECPIELVDERLTTVEGERALLAMDTSRRKRKAVIDVVAAQLIL